MAEREHQRLLRAAIAREGESHRLLLAGDVEGAGDGYREAAWLYRRSWESSHERAFGRLIGMLKDAVLAGSGREEAAYARRVLGDDGDSPTSWYALALAALIEGDDQAASRAIEGMYEGGGAFALTADAIRALAAGDREAYESAVGAIVADFEARAEHLTGVQIADTALVLERLAERRGLAARLRSPLLPADW